ncbi:unnamed protein product, partial [Rotaria sordida]
MAYASGGGSSLKFIIVGDLNNDTNLDIVLANYGTSNLGVLFGYGNGNFENQMILSNGLTPHPTSITIGDFNGDSVVDIAVADDDGMHLDMLLGNGNRLFESRTSEGIRFDSHLLALASGDFNNDKRSDIAIIYDGMDNNGFAVAGGNEEGNEISQLSIPWGLYVDDGQTIYVADQLNYRIVEWKWDATNGQVVA